MKKQLEGVRHEQSKWISCCTAHHCTAQLLLKHTFHAVQSDLRKAAMSYTLARTQRPPNILPFIAPEARSAESAE
eukprot:m.12014 g.12014  ORF g.12014 m.12014 type:complete len:75 (-) comp4161_c0_seq1:937-1161(-)